MSDRALAFRPLRIVPSAGAPEGSLPLHEAAPWPATPFAARVASATDLPASAKAVVLASPDASLVARYRAEGRTVVVEAPDAATARAALKAGALGVLPSGRPVRMGERKITEKSAPPARARPGPGPSEPLPVPVPAAREARRARRPGEPTEPTEHSVAVVGLACVFPGANGKEAFWDLVTSGRSAIAEVPKERWDPARHYDPDPSVPDKTYTKIGGFVRDFRFDPMRFRVPPNVVKQLDSTQQWALTCAWDALVDAGYQPRPGAPGKAFDRARCAVILGNSMGGEMRGSAQLRVRWNDASAALDRVLSATIPEAERKRLLAEVSREVKAGLPEITEDTMPGDLSNVISGRIANLLDLGGKNITTDAACASSLAAIDSAVRTLASGEADLVLCGGADRSMDAATYVMFCKIGALSPDGSRPFDASANGFVMGEGAGILVLKRLADALRDGDRVYAVVRGVGSSSDGKGKGITAPNPEGQKLALRRAYAVSEMETSFVQLVEAHGTSTPVGDPAEVASMAAVWEAPPGAKIALGSVKSQIGHLKSAAGAASLIKAALALHHKVLPPSINFRTPNPHVDWERVPFRVQTAPAAWPDAPPGEPRRAGVSAFGFGGTNFHAVLEEFVPEYHGRLTAHAKNAKDAKVDVAFEGSTDAGPRPTSSPQTAVVLLRSDSLAALAEACAALAARAPAAVDPAWCAAASGGAGEHRLAVALPPGVDAAQRLREVAALVADPAKRKVLATKGAAYGSGPRKGRLAFLFPGQGSQYAGMLEDLRATFPIVEVTFREADEVLLPYLGKPLTSLLGDEEALKETSVTQPAMLAADVAILRLLAEHGVRPDAVAGHSLGEYAALVAAGVLTFPDALVAVSARGKEMASVDVPDLGGMAGVAAPPDVVDEILRTIDGYVVSANKNSPKQTVIAGATPAVEKAMEACAARGLDVMPLPVSAAFHSAIVAPASEPLRRVLARLGVSAPRVPVIANVNVEPYPADRDAILDLLSKQVAAPVEWQRTMHRLHADGMRVFVEVGPKRALTGFVEANLGDKPDVEAVLTNHPKKGGVASWTEAMARLAALGVWEPSAPAAPPAHAKQAKDAKPVSAPSAAAASFPVMASPVPSGALAPSPAPAQARSVPEPLPQPEPSFHAIAQRFLAEVEEHAASAKAVEARVRELGLELDDIVVSGASLGLPGRAHRVFDDANLERLFRGESGIDRLDEPLERAILEKNVVRLVKDGGEPRFEAIQALKEVIHLAGRRGAFDLVGEFGVPKEFAAGLDITSSLAVGAAIDALRDAGIPLVRDEVVTRAGHRIPGQWVLPAELRDSTGIVVASAFPGLNNLVDDLSRYFADRFGGEAYRELEAVYHEALELVKEPSARSRLTAWFTDHAAALRKDPSERYTFNRHFLFEILSLAHAEVAEFVRARGPNTQVNSACASTAIAIGVAEDWIRTGRAKRVLVLGADDVTSDTLMPWIGTGFLAAGAATTSEIVSEAALPFDRRRHGMIVGMGAVGLMLERAQDVAARGMVPVARLLATRISNSAFHGSRLHAEHIEGEFEALVEATCRRTGLDRDALAAQTLFVSHETYTPARGGSAGAEVAALRRAFGASTEKILIANVKGFTGHPMGAGIEDALALKALQYGRVPPIANLKEPDPELGPLNLSRGGTHDRRFAIRFAAGFGSQLGIVAFEQAARGDQRVVDPAKHRAWLDRLGGGELKVEHRALRLVGARPSPAAPAAHAKGAKDAKVEVSLLPATAPPPAPRPLATVAPTAPPPAAPPATPTTLASSGSLGVAEDEVLRRLTALVAEKTGYPPEALDATLDLEADLGIDTVKQAELFGEVRDAYALPREDDFRIKDYNTLAKIAGYVASRLGAPHATGARGRSEAPAERTAPAGAVQKDAKPVAASGTLAPAAPVVAPPAAAPASPPAPIVSTSVAPPPAAASTLASSGPLGVAGEDEVLRRLTSIVAEKTGYPPEALEADLDLEADLGIDTVKQAELFGEIRELYKLPREEGFKIKDHNTLRKIAAYVASRMPRTPEVNGASASAPAAPVASTFPAPGLTPRVPVLVPLGPPAGPAWDPRGKRVAVADGPLAAPVAALLAAAGAVVADAPPFDAVVWQGEARDLFELARTKGPFRLVAVTHLGGAHGVERPTGDASQGALTGLAKGLAREWPDRKVVALDLDPADPADARARAAVDELLRADAVEVGRRGAARVTLAVAPAPAPAGALPAETVVLATGGGQGIAAACVLGLAKRSRVRAVLLGRTPLAPDAVRWAALDEAGWQEARKKALQDLHARGEKATPVAVERALAPFRKSAEIHRTLEALRGAGAEAVYLDGDAADAAAVARAAEACRARFGRVDLVLHAAGVEESRRLEDKDAAAWTRTFAPKVDGARHLLDACPDARTFVLFGSVAGRFGNQSQADYSAANDALAKLAWTERSRARDVRVLEWGPWGETGMATRGSTLKVLAAAGVAPIPTEDGVAAFLAEYAGPGRAEVVLAGDLGALETAAPAPVSAPAAAAPQATPPLTLDPAKDAWLLDHAVEGVPYLPGVHGVSLFEDAVSGAPLEDVRFEYPVKFLRNRARTMRVDRDGASVALATEGTGARVHFRARVAAPSPRPHTTHAAPVHGAVDSAAIYARFFHGPAFRVLGSAKFGPTAVVAKGAAPAPSAARNLDLEAGLQAAGLHALATAGVMALPHGVQRLERWERADPGALELRVAFRAAKDGVWTYDVEGVTGGRVAYRLTGLSLIAIGEGPTLAADPVPVAWRAVAGRDVAEVAVGPDVDDVLPLLHPEEAAAARAHAHDKRRREWVAATLAGKAALRRAAGPTPWARLRILNHPDGYRTVEGAPLAVSVGHAAGVAVGVAFDPTRESAGVDVEAVERRGAPWREEAFAPSERHALRTPEDETRAWTAKEALLKALGRGLAEDLHAVKVTLDGGIGYDASGAVKERLAALGPRATRAEAVLLDGRAYAVCVLEAP